MSYRLPSFAVKVAVTGLRAEQVADAKREISEELQHRPHVVNPRVIWDDETKLMAVIAILEGTDAEQTARGLAEEVHEILPAIFAKPAGMHVEMISAQDHAP